MRTSHIITIPLRLGGEPSSLSLSLSHARYTAGVTVGELYMMGTDGVLRRRVPMSDKHLVISESRAGDAGGHFAADIMAKKV